MKINKIRAPGVAFEDGGGSASKNAQPATMPILRFPFFDVGYNPDMEGCFIDLYERSGLDRPHAFFEYAKGVTVFASFRKDAELYMSPGDAEFWTYVKRTQAEEMVVLDVNFDAYNLARLLDVLGERQTGTRLTVTVFTAGGDSATTIKANQDGLKTMIDALENIGVEVYELSGENAKYIHDRFALVDGCVWHFGAAAGGMHDKLHAYSGPWEDKGSAFKNLTNDLMKGAIPIL